MKITLLLLITLTAQICADSDITGEQTTEETFSTIYQQGTWGKDEEGNGHSGLGSTIPLAQPYMQFLKNFLEEQEISSVVDLGCGDWTFSQKVDWGKVDYIGYDVVKSVIEQNRIKFAAENIRFIHADAITEELAGADLLLCKDVFQHLTNEDITLLIGQFKKFRHCLITNDINPNNEGSCNGTIERGQWRPVDLTKEPFNLRGEKFSPSLLEIPSSKCSRLQRRVTKIQKLIFSREKICDDIHLG